MNTHNEDTVKQLPLPGGGSIPQMGFGTFQLPRKDTQAAVEQAIALGYRHVDTAAAYYNEAEVGAALAMSALPRGQVFVAGKLRNVDQGRDSVRRALDTTLENLGLDYLDMYMIHWPVPSKGLYVETCEVLCELQAEGLIRNVGVCNFLAEHLHHLHAAIGVLPVVNQVEIHPCFSQPDVRHANEALGIITEAYSPLGQGKDLTHPVIVELAHTHALSPAQLILAWHVHAGHVVIPKTLNEHRMRENLQAASHTLPPSTMAALNALHTDSGRIGGDPRTFEYPQTLEDIAQRTSTN